MNISVSVALQGDETIEKNAEQLAEEIAAVCGADPASDSIYVNVTQSASYVPPPVAPPPAAPAAPPPA